jgi:O-antigen ligase
VIRAIRRKIPFSSTVLLRSVILTGLIIGLLGLGFMVSRVPLEFVLIAVAAPPMLLLALSQLEYGILGVIWTAACVRFKLSTGTESPLVASLLVTGMFVLIWLTRMLVRDRKLYLKPASTNVPLLAFLLTAVISFAWSNAFLDPLVVVKRTWPFVQLGALGVIILLPGAFLLIANNISEVRWLKLLCWSMVFIGVLFLADYFFHVRLSFINTAGLFSLWFVSTAYSQALFNRKLPTWLRLALIGLTGVWMYIWFIQRVTWLSGWLPSVVAMAVISFVRSKKLFLVLLLSLAIYLGTNWEYYTNTVFAAESNESGHTRLAAWEQNWQVTGKHLLFGTGPAGYAAYYMSYFPNKAMATHSNYIDVLSQTGIVGLLLILWFFCALGRTGYRLRLRLKGAGDFSEGMACGTLAGWLGCVVAMGLGDWLFPFAYTQGIAGFDHAVYSWVMLGGMAALDSINRGESSP